MKVKLLVAYDIKEGRREEYYQYIIAEFLPQAQQLGLILNDVYETVYGNYPSRLIAFVARDEATMNSALHDELWASIETRLGQYVTDYEKRMVRLKPNFQFFTPRRRRQYG